MRTKTKAQKLARHMRKLAATMRQASQRSVFYGVQTQEAMSYISSCRRIDAITRTRLIFTRDAGHHTSGWMRNPDYERCYHLSLSPLPSIIETPFNQAELDRDIERRWVKAFFGDDVRYLWAESPKSDVGKREGVWHWRLFCDENWQAILPRGEVYSSELTELGWKSASQVFEEKGQIIQSLVDPT